MSISRVWNGFWGTCAEVAEGTEKLAKSYNKLGDAAIIGANACTRACSTWDLEQLSAFCKQCDTTIADLTATMEKLPETHQAAVAAQITRVEADKASAITQMAEAGEAQKLDSL